MRPFEVFLIVALSLSVAGCSTMSPGQEARQALVWEAATQCASRMATLKVDYIDAGYQERARAETKSQPLVASGRDSPCAGTVTKTFVPIEVLEGMILVPVTLNEYHHATLLLDTGASYTVLRPGVLERLGVYVPASAQRQTLTLVGGKNISMPLVRVRSLKAGDLAVEDLDIVVYDVFPGVPRVEGLLSADFLNRFRVTIDHGSRQLTLEVIQPSR